MVAAVIFVLTFLVIGLGVVVTRLRRPGLRPPPAGGAAARRRRRFVAVSATIVIVGLGVAVPLAIALVNRDDHAKSAPGAWT